MPDGIKSTIRLFADDTIAYLTRSNDKDSNDLQKDLDELAIWETKWKMAFHPDKCNVLIISRKNNTIATSYKLHGHTLEPVKSAKYLGCTFTSEAVPKEDRLIPPKLLSRNMHDRSFQIPAASNYYRKFSFFPRTIKDWNSLPPGEVSAPSVEAFKASVTKLN